MREEKSRKTSCGIEQIIGELALYTPLILIAYFGNMLLSCVISMLCVFIFKLFFYNSLHLNKWYWCVTLSYSLFITISIFYKGLGLTSPFLENQPMLLIMICVGVTYLNHYAGVWQHKLTHKNIYAMSEEELYAHCRQRGLDDVDCKIAKYIVIERLKGKALYDAIGYSERQTKRKRAQILKIIK